MIGWQGGEELAWEEHYAILSGGRGWQGECVRESVAGRRLKGEGDKERVKRRRRDVEGLLFTYGVIGKGGRAD